jgi:hypothetical protein
MGPNPNEQYIREKQQQERRGRIGRRDGQPMSRTSRLVTGAILLLALLVFLAFSVLWALGIIVLPPPAAPPVV